MAFSRHGIRDVTSPLNSVFCLPLPLTPSQRSDNWILNQSICCHEKEEILYMTQTEKTPYLSNNASPRA